MKSLTRQDIYVYSAWIISLLAILGALIYSEILQLPPCSLCWYQRIAMYPLVLILLVGILLRDKNISKYVLPLATMGLLISFYQILLQAKVITPEISPCAFGIDCSRIDFELFGFLTIPMQSFLGFLSIQVLMVLHLKEVKKIDGGKAL